MNANELSRVGCDEERETPAVREGCEASWMIAWGFLGSHDGICCVLFFFSTCHQRGEREKKTHIHTADVTIGGVHGPG